MKKSNLLLATLFLSLLGFSQNQKTISNDEKILGLSKIWKEVETIYPYLNESGLNWDSLYTSYIPKVLGTPNDTAYYKCLNEFLCNLKEGHTKVYSPYKQNNIGLVTIALTYINTDNSFYVIGIGEEFDKKIELGSKLLSINNIDAKKYADSVFYKQTNYKKRIFYNYVATKLLSGIEGSRLKLKFKNRNGEIYEIETIRKPKFSQWKSYKSVYSRKYFDFKSINNVSYVKIGTFHSFEVIKKFYAYADSINQNDNIIFDIRGNFGGTSYGNYIVNLLTEDSIIYSYRKSKESNAYYKALGMFNDSLVQKILNSNRNLSSYKKYEEYYYNNNFKTDTIKLQNNGKTRGVFKDKNVILLVDRFTISAAETFAITLRNNTDVKIIGQPTCGSTGQPIIIPLPSGGHARIISSIPLYNDGSAFDYIIPDIIIEPSISDFLNGNDAVLDKAVQILSED